MQIGDWAGVDIGAEATRQLGPEEGEVIETLSGEKRPEGGRDRPVEELTPADSAFLRRHLDDPLGLQDLDDRILFYLSRFGLLLGGLFLDGFLGLLDTGRDQNGGGRPVGSAGLRRDPGERIGFLDGLGAAIGDGKCPGRPEDRHHGDRDEGGVGQGHSNCTQSFKSSK